ncbi:MAG: YfhO family protein [Lachnospiraceae bacterium]|nr:YfhO family protein [Lachnospiraceae bacterium]
MRSSRRKTILLYSLCYLFLMGLLFRYFYVQGRSLVYQGDGWRQHLRALHYYGKYLRGSLHHVLIDRSLSPERFGPDFGYGADVLTTLQYYCLGDPLAALSVLVPARFTMAFYEALILIRPYLAGLAFLWYAFLRGEKRTAPCLTGALLYSFSGTILYIGMLHPYFVNPMIYLPLLLAGSELALRDPGEKEASHPFRRYLPFSCFVALSALSNFYFFYMLAIFTAAYGIARLLQLHGARGERGARLIGAACSDGIRLLGAAVIGTIAAGVTLLPVLVQFSDDPRSGVKFASPLLYDRSYYEELVRNLFTFINHPQYDTELCYALPFVPLLLILLLRKGHRTLKLCLLCILGMLLVPAAGIALNGFSYLINRWTWSAAMLAGWIAVRGAGELEDLLSHLRQDTRRRAAVRITGIALPLLTVVSVAWNITSGYAPAYGAFPSEFIERMSPDAYLAAASDNETAAVAAVSLSDGAGFCRYSGRNLNWNAALATGLSSTQFEFSLANGVVSEYFQMIGNNDEQNFAYLALDDRMPALSLAGVRYYTLAYDNYYEYRFLPFGVVDRGMTGRYHVYENPSALPFGTVFHDVLPHSAWENLSPAGREEAAMHAAVIRDADLPILSDPGCVCSVETLDAPISRELPFRIEAGEDVTCTQSGFDVSGWNAEAVILLEESPAPEAELLLDLEGLTVTGDEGLYPISLMLRAEGEEFLTKTIPYKTPLIQYYSDWHDFLVNFGWQGEQGNAIVIRFPSPGIYRYDRLAVLTRPMAGIPETFAALSAESMEGTDLHLNPISRATREITGEIRAERDGVLLMQLPYSRGFRAFVDGVQTPVLPTDTMFLSVPVTGGTHQIRLDYRTPGGAAGALCSLTGIILLFLMLFLRRRSR